MTTPRPDSRLDTRLGPYRIERIIGRGGMGVVYLAEQTELGRKVALKLLPDEIAHDKDFRARFDRESKLAASIDHPNIIPLYEAGEIDGTAYLAMRYVEGTDLATRLRDGPLEPETAVEILDQVASALDAAHQRGLVHRDVKPGNVLLDATAREGRDHAYLTDFGLTKQAGSESGLTRAGAFMGTPAYMAPEQIEGRDVDGRADQYSLAAMAFEALTGVVPFKRDQEIAVAMAHLKDPVPSAVARQPDLPAAVDTVLAQGMAKESADRYPSCAALITDLRTALGGGTVVARPIRRGARRTPVLVAAVLGVALVAIAGLALASGLGGAGSDRPSPSGSGSEPAQASAVATPSADPSAFPSSPEAALLAKLPASVKARCHRGSYRPQDVSGFGGESPTRPTASLACDLPVGQGPETVGFVSFDAPAGQADNWATHQVDGSQGNVPGAAPDPGDCTTVPKAIGRWSVAGTDVGAFGCYTRDGVHWLYWAYQDANVAAFARSSDPDRGPLVAWWNANARFLLP